MMTLILKPLNRCNLRCAYCSVGDKSLPRTMREERMRAALRFFAGQVRARHEQEAAIIFHGGEPMLLPPAQYDRCISALREEFPDISFRLSMQSNGTLLDGTWIGLLQKHQIGLGISIDGSEAIHDKERRDVSGAPTWQHVVDKIQMSQDHGVPVAALMVVTKYALQEDLSFLRLFDAMGVPLKINPLLCLGDAIKNPELSLAPGDYGRYLARVFREAAVQNLALRISPLAELVTALLYREVPRGCTFSADCARRFLSIDPDGVIYPCGHFADMQRLPIGTIDEGISRDGTSVLDALEARRNTALPEPCRGCRELFYCSAGCSCDHLTSQTMRQPCALCEDLRYLLHFLRTEGMELLEAQLTAQREALMIQGERS